MTIVEVITNRRRHHYRRCHCRHYDRFVLVAVVVIIIVVFICTVVIISIRSLRSYDGNCNENVTLTFDFALSKLFCDYSMLVTLYKIGGVHFRLLGTNGFHVKLKNERFTVASFRCRQNLKYENFMSSFGRLRQNTAPKSVPHVQHDYFSSFNQSNY